MAKTIWAVPVLLFVVSCNYRIEKPQPEDPDLKNGVLISYATVRQKVLGPRCVSCHGNSGGCNLETYENVKARAGDIVRRALVERSMPPGRPLTNMESRILTKWINDGMPNDGTMPPDELKPNFESIKKHLFEMKCISCHSAGGEAARVPLNDYRAVMESPREIVIPGNPEESSLMIVVTRTDEKRMPPPDVSDALSEKQIKVLNDWIMAGAPEKE